MSDPVVSAPEAFGKFLHRVMHATQQQQYFPVLISRIAVSVMMVGPEKVHGRSGVEKMAQPDQINKTSTPFQRVVRREPIRLAYSLEFQARCRAFEDPAAARVM
jgi:hypothetical protein